MRVALELKHNELRAELNDYTGTYAASNHTVFDIAQAGLTSENGRRSDEDHETLLDERVAFVATADAEAADGDVDDPGAGEEGHHHPGAEHLALVQL